MIRTTFDECRAALRTTGTYQTAPDHRAPVRSAPGLLTTLSFCWAPFSVFPKCAIRSALGTLTTDVWAHFCFACIPKAESLGMNVILDGWEHRRDCAGPVVYVANHMSTLETVILPFILLGFGPFNVMVKQSLTHLPFLSKAAVDMGLIALGRKSPREDLMTMFQRGGEALAKGSSVLVFSQGTRSPVFVRKGFSSIGAKLAEKAGVPVMPIAVKTDCLPAHKDAKIFKDFGTVDPMQDLRFRCGPACTGSAKAMQTASVDWLAQTLEEWHLPVEG